MEKTFFLRLLAMNREFADNDREIKTQIVQNCLSHKLRLRMKALQNPKLTLTQLLDAGKAMEMSKSQAETIEEKQNINKLSTKYTRRASKQNKNGGHVDRNSDGAKTADRNSVPGERGKCRNSGKGYPHPGGKTTCPAYGKVVEAVEIKTTMKPYVDQRNPTRNKSLKLKSHGTTFKTLLMKTPAPKTETKMVIHFL